MNKEEQKEYNKRYHSQNFKKKEYFEKAVNLRKVNRNRDILYMRSAGNSYQDIADSFGITKQRVHQILKDYAHARVKTVFEYRNKHQACELCGSNINLNIHHIDKKRRNNEESNFVRVCHKCHLGLHIGRVPDGYIRSKRHCV